MTKEECLNKIESLVVYDTVKNNGAVTLFKRVITDDSVPHIEATPRDIFFSEKETIPIQKSEGKICALAITAFPPDIPIIFPGERITKEKIERIHSLKKNNTLITGCEHGITVLKGYV